MTITKVLKAIGLYLKKKKPEMFTFACSGGAIATAIFSSRASIKAEALLNEAEIAKKDELTPLEKIMVAGPIYIPTVVVCAATIACSISAHILNRRKQAALTSAYIFLDQMFSNYRKHIYELYGPDADVNVSRAVLVENLPKEEERQIGSDSDLRLFFEENIGRYFRRSMLEVQDAEYQLNRKFAMEGEVSLNDFLELLALPTEVRGSAVGWSQEVICDYTTPPWIDFKHELVVLDDGSECYHIHISEPMEPLDLD